MCKLSNQCVSSKSSSKSKWNSRSDIWSPSFTKRDNSGRKTSLTSNTYDRSLAFSLQSLEKTLFWAFLFHTLFPASVSGNVGQINHTSPILPYEVRGHGPAGHWANRKLLIYSVESLVCLTGGLHSLDKDSCKSRQTKLNKFFDFKLQLYTTQYSIDHYLIINV